MDVFGKLRIGARGWWRGRTLMETNSKYGDDLTTKAPWRMVASTRLAEPDFNWTLPTRTTQWLTLNRGAIVRRHGPDFLVNEFDGSKQ